MRLPLRSLVLEWKFARLWYIRCIRAVTLPNTTACIKAGNTHQHI